MSGFEEPERDVDPAAVERLVRDHRAQVVDVREDYEREAGRIAGSLHVRMDRLAGEAESLDRDRPVIFYCRVGARSGMAAAAFAAAGWDAYNLRGGLVAWVDAGRPLEPPGGRVAEH